MKWLFYPKIKRNQSYFDHAKMLMAWRISVAFVVIFSIISTLYTWTSNEGAIPSYLIFAAGVFSLIYLHTTGKYPLVFWIYSVFGLIVIHYSLNFNHELNHYIDFLWLVVSLYLTFIGLGKQIGILFTIINAALLSYYMFFSLNKHLEIITTKNTIQLFSEYLEILFALFVLGYLIHQYYIFQQHSAKKLKDANDELESQNLIITEKNKENILLLKEVHHRVKNNLQIITSLLRLQKNDLSPEISLKFDEAINRIMTIALIHSKLYESNDFSKINIDNYINELIKDIVAAQVVKIPVSHTVKSDVQDFGLKTIVPFGLMLNELLSNSFKHAFNDLEMGEINIFIKKIDSEFFELDYRDNGIWKADHSERVKFGLELIETLTEQLEGKCIRNDSAFNFRLKNLDI